MPKRTKYSKKLGFNSIYITTVAVLSEIFYLCTVEYIIHFETIMKQKLILLIAFILMSVNAFADGLTATLQQGDQMTPFYGVDAFKNAYNAADSGAVITLSAGYFNDLGRDHVRKSIKIVGNYGLNKDSLDCTIVGSSLVIDANDVSVDGVYVNRIYLNNISNFKVVHSRFSIIYWDEEAEHINTFIDQCVVESDRAIAQGINYSITNSTIGHFDKSNTKSNIAYIANCYIYDWYERGRYNCYQPYAIYKNNILGIDNGNYTTNNSLSVDSPNEFYNNVFLRLGRNDYIVSVHFSEGCINIDNEYSGSKPVSVEYQYPNKDASFGNGQDGTPIGITGGTGFSDYPNIPRIIESNIDSKTDEEGKLNVIIKVSVPQ